MAGKRQIITRQVIDDDDNLHDEHDEEKINAGVSLFALGDVEEKKIERIHVHRHDPDEGFLGEMPPTSTEADIKNKYGGSMYRLEAKNGQGRIVKVKHMRIAGDPIFISEVHERRWRKQNGMPVDGQGAAPEQMTLQNVLLLLEEREEKRRRELFEKEERDRRERQEKEERERKDREERELRLRKEEEDREDRRRKDQDEREERRRREAREDEERRARQHREDLDRMKADAERAAAAQQAMFQQTLALFKAESQKASAADPVELLIKGVTLAKELGGGEGMPQDPLSIILGRAPELLGEIRKTASAAVSEIRGKPAPAEEEGAGEGGGETPEDPGVTFKGTGAKLLRAVAAKMVREGKNPEREFMAMAASYLRAPTAGTGNGASTNKAPRRRGRPRKAAASKKPPEPTSAPPS